MNKKIADRLVFIAKGLMAFGDSAHSVLHLDAVWENAKKINRHYSMDGSLLKVACYWHDISYSVHGFGVVQYFFESVRSVRIAKRYFDKFNVSRKDKKLLFNAILLHNFVSWFLFWKKRSLLAKIVYDADFLESMNPKRHSGKNKTFLNRFASLWLRFLGGNSKNLKKRLLILPKSKSMV